ncbi:hypothetical protein SNEBB_011470 [Seison nebaliae]|nr:hypothetical protein SNEBB_011470 [Seison nebaliae]
MSLTTISNRRNRTATEDKSFIRSNSLNPISFTPKPNVISSKQYEDAKKLAEDALQKNKIFSIFGPYPTLRRSLRQRGWVERLFHDNSNDNQQNLQKKNKLLKENDCSSDDDGNDDSYSDSDLIEEELRKPWLDHNSTLLSQMVRNRAPNFIWCIRRNAISCDATSHNQTINHYGGNESITTKTGLCMNIRNLPWYDCCDPNEFYPRCYRLSNPEDFQDFQHDFNLSICSNILKLFYTKYPVERLAISSSAISSSRSTITDEDNLPIQFYQANQRVSVKESLDFIKKVKRESFPFPFYLPVSVGMMRGISEALQREEIGSSKESKHRPKRVVIQRKIVEFSLESIQKFLDTKHHKDVDRADIEWFQSSTDLMSQTVTIFNSINKDIRYDYHNIDFDDVKDDENVIRKCRNILLDLFTVSPQFDIDGMSNMWILKPGAKSRGRGIVVMNSWHDIICCTQNSLQQYVVQKYIETPLLIHDTKFDIRQWFIVTNWNPLTVWIYKDFYLRFCTHKFGLHLRNNAVHLCNNSIQKHILGRIVIDDNLPSDLMWTSDEFKKYLIQTNNISKMDSLIKPGIKKAILAALLSSQELFEKKSSLLNHHSQNNFELFGADFMISRDFRPWLIEINSSPTMARNTRVTKIMCEQVLEDMVKVVIDKSENKFAKTGKFELMAKLPQLTQPPYVGMDLKVEGKHVKTDVEVKFNRTLPQIQNSIRTHRRPIAQSNSFQQTSSASTDSSTLPLARSSRIRRSQLKKPERNIRTSKTLSGNNNRLLSSRKSAITPTITMNICLNENTNKKNGKKLSKTRKVFQTTNTKIFKQPPPKLHDGPQHHFTTDNRTFLQIYDTFTDTNHQSNMAATTVLTSGPTNVKKKNLSDMIIRNHSPNTSSLNISTSNSPTSSTISAPSTNTTSTITQLPTSLFTQLGELTQPMDMLNELETDMNQVTNRSALILEKKVRDLQSNSVTKYSKSKRWKGYHTTENGVRLNFISKKSNSSCNIQFPYTGAMSRNRNHLIDERMNEVSIRSLSSSTKKTKRKEVKTSKDIHDIVGNYFPKIVRDYIQNKSPYRYSITKSLFDSNKSFNHSSNGKLTQSPLYHSTATSGIASLLTATSTPITGTKLLRTDENSETSSSKLLHKISIEATAFNN